MKIKIMLGMMLMSLASCLVYSQNLKHPWSVADGGGGKSSGGTLTLSTSVGQPTIGFMNGGGFTLEAGYLPGVRQLSGTTSALSEQLQNGWNMLAVPFVAGDMRKTTLYPTAASFAYDYVGGSYQREDTLKNGIAYWMKFPPAQSVAFSGVAFTPETLIVVPGWNMIGSISYPALTSTIVTVGTVLKSFYYGYLSSGYYAEDTLKPALGYWIKVSALGKLIITPAPAIPPAGSSSVVVNEGQEEGKSSVANFMKKEGFQQLTIKDAASQERSVYFSGEQKEIDVKALELPPSQPSGLDVRFISQRMAEMPDGQDEVRKVEFPILITGAVYPLSVSWEQSAGNTYVLEVQLKGQKSKEYPMSERGSFVINEDELIKMKIRITNETKIALPKEYAMYQNYPNPFNPTTKIQYDLPKSSRVSLRVYNVIGQEVMTLVNEDKAAGRYVAELNGNNLPSGVYYYRIEAHQKEGGATNDFTTVRKFLLLK